MTKVGNWRVRGPDTGGAAELLADGLALLDGLGDEPVLRWYRSTGPALVLGRGQSRLEIPPTPELPVVTRYSGGGVVLLDPHLLSLDVLVPAGHPWLAGDDLGAVFLHVGTAWAAALRRLGVADVTVHDAPGTARRRGSPREQLLAAVCYATLGRGEVLAGGRKLVGLSQRRRRQGALVQCGLLERWAPGPILAALGADADDMEITGAAVGLHDLLDDVPAEPALRREVERAFAAADPAPD